jgi:hypothetical protein
MPISIRSRTLFRRARMGKGGNEESRWIDRSGRCLPACLHIIENSFFDARVFVLIAVKRRFHVVKRRSPSSAAGGATDRLFCPVNSPLLDPQNLPGPAADAVPKCGIRRRFIAVTRVARSPLFCRCKTPMMVRHPRSRCAAPCPDVAGIWPRPRSAARPSSVLR